LGVAIGFTGSGCPQRTCTSDVRHARRTIKKTNIKNDVCLHSDRKAKPSYFVENKIYFRKNYEKK
ncbi:hypothetical protein OLX26_02735, partial [Streptococcus agalactiae]|uniref:hypothetical protein n=1 Tax=Streptococcus agalactiae TaxID=1311 RepID=UPI00221FE6DB